VDSVRSFVQPLPEAGDCHMYTGPRSIAFAISQKGQEVSTKAGADVPFLFRAMRKVCAAAAWTETAAKTPRPGPLQPRGGIVALKQCAGGPLTTPLMETRPPPLAGRESEFWAPNSFVRHPAAAHAQIGPAQGSKAPTAAGLSCPISSMELEEGGQTPHPDEEGGEDQKGRKLARPRWPCPGTRNNLQHHEARA